ncbi:MAG: MBL fold metallo-hydrolase [Robiginitomaculum sp.]|nr:MAG: MBL fold metallo-hydrolase [Robiginitomaculum sp.]
MTGFVSAATAADDPTPKTKIEATDLGSGIYMLTGRGGNMGLSTGADGAFLIDDQYAPLSSQIKAAIANLSDTPVRFLINTHWHGDHTGGNESFGDDAAIIVAHENVRKRLSTDQVLKLWNSQVKASPQIAWPVITFTEEISFHQNGQRIDVRHVADAHTDGDAFVYFVEANVLHMGDVFFSGRYPFIDTGSGGSIDGVIAAQKVALALVTDDTKIIPGHGALANQADLVASLAMIETVRERVAKAIADGMTLEQAQAADLLADLNEQWGGGFINGETMVKIVYGDLAGE